MTSFQRIQIKPSNETDDSPLSSLASLQTVSIEASTPNVVNSAYYPSPTDSVFNPTTDEFQFRPFDVAQVDTLPTIPTTVISVEHANRRVRNASRVRRYVHLLI
jgi:hypothetical protein